MQKLNLNHIPEAPENKDFWVVGTANREGSIDSNSYKKNLSAMATKNNSSSYYVDTYPQNPKEGDIITFTDDTPSKEYVNGEWKDRSAGGGLPQITLLQVPTYGGQITIADYLSAEDIATLEESGVAVAVLTNEAIPGAKINYIAVSSHVSLGGASVNRSIAFYGPQGLKFIFKSAYTDWTVEMVPFIPVINRSAAGTNLVMASIGFTTDVLNRIFSGEITRLAVPTGLDAPEVLTIARGLNAFGEWEIEMARCSKFETLIYRYVGGVGSITTVYPD